jgi:hypothetical protein
MDRILKMGVCLTLIVVLSCPAIVLAKNAGQSTFVNMTNQVYDGGAKALDKTEGILNQCLKSTFSLFNPCLDIVKMCTDVALKPLNYPFDYVEGKLYKPKVVNKRVEIPAPQKPVMPKQ